MKPHATIQQPQDRFDKPVKSMGIISNSHMRYIQTPNGERLYLVFDEIKHPPITFTFYCK